MKNMSIRLHKIGDKSENDRKIVAADIPASPPFERDDYFFYYELPEANVSIAAAYQGSIAPHRLYFKSTADLTNHKRHWQQFVDVKDDVQQYAFSGKSIYLLSSLNDDKDTIEEISFDANLKPSRKVVYRNSQMNFDSIVASANGVYVIAHEKLNTVLIFIDYKNQKPLLFKQASGIELDELAGSIHNDTVYLTKSAVDQADALVSFHYRRGFTEIPLSDFKEPTTALSVSTFEAQSADGQKIPYQIVSKKGVELHGGTPTLLRSYAAYGNIYRPYYDRQLIDWFERGGTVVYCYARGGGELGESWHKAAMKTKKINSVLDTIACAEDLVKRGLSSPKKLGFFSGSAGGIIAGNLIVRRPDLFAAVVSLNGVMELSKLQFATSGGAANVPEFGDMNIPAEAQAIRDIDPYLQIVKGKEYPATLCIHGFNDPRVPVWMSGKFCNKLMEAQSGKRPIFMKTEFGEGHGMASDRSVRSERWSDIITFLSQELDIDR